MSGQEMVSRLDAEYDKEIRKADVATLADSECICTICDGPFDLEKEGGSRGEMGIMPVAFCPTCHVGIMDYAEQHGMIMAENWEPDDDDDDYDPVIEQEQDLIASGR